MQTQRAEYALVPHQAHPPLGVSAVLARVLGVEGPWLQLRWRIEGAGRLVVPRFAGRGRADGLWRTTCFELFLRPEGAAAYAEYNLSPSERWAAYDFDAPRQAMRNRPVLRDCACTLRRGGSVAIFDAAIPLAALPVTRCAMALTAVIEEAAGEGEGEGEAGQPARGAPTTGAGERHRPGASQRVDTSLEDDVGAALRPLGNDGSADGHEATNEHRRGSSAARADDASGAKPGEGPATRKSYWALAHPPGAPDFHDPSCFTATLAPPGAS